MYSDAEDRRKAGARPSAPGSAQIPLPPTVPARGDDDHLSRLFQTSGTSLGVDLVAAGIRAIGYLFEH
jgi:hypothetical protein